jgi:ribonucleoside-diphosphate reductase alpha chain
MGKRNLNRGVNVMGLPTDYQTFIHLSRYSRWLDESNRRETWEETISRLVNYFKYHIEHNLEITLAEQDADIWKELYNSIHSLQVMPSMRAMMAAGPALERENIAGYNCSYIPIDSPRSFDEILYILMNGTGVGYSVERQYVNNLPTVPFIDMEETDDVISVADSKEGWARAFKDLISFLYSGRVPQINMDKVRPSGSRLNVFGGRASGPDPLKALFDFTIKKFINAKGRKLTTIECHDIVCKTGEVVVVGGVRRSALISLSNVSDDRLRSAKKGQWWETNPERSLANNSAVYTGIPDTATFMKEWSSLYESKSGERGMFNRSSAQMKAKSTGRREWDIDFGTNPCSEIILRPNQFCNLTEVVCRVDDTRASLKKKIRMATILGTVQATMTNFGYLRKRWQNNTEEERLLGVSLTGIMDCRLINGVNKDSSIDSLLSGMKNYAVDINKEWAAKLNIPQSTAVTCVKPSGTVSQLVDSASGIHARHSPYYIRTVRGDVKDPLTQFMSETGIPYEMDQMRSDSTVVFSFPIKSPDNAVYRNDKGAIEQLKFWKTYAEHWCEHKPSVTISVKENEWVEVGAWCWANFDSLSGVSFLPHTDHTYKQAPYQDITKKEYEKQLSNFPDKIDWSKLTEWEKEDTTKGTQELACTAGVCELVDI